MGLPLAATAVRATIGLGGATYTISADTASFSGELVAENVPYGDAMIAVEAVIPGSAVLQRDVSLRIGRALNVVAVDFGGSTPGGADGGVSEAGVEEPTHVDSNPIRHIIRALRGSSISGGVLAESTDANQDGTYRTNIDGMTSRLGGTPAAFTVRFVSLELLPTSRNVAALDELWSDRVAVSLQPKSGGGPEIEIASVDSVVSTGVGPVSFSITADRAVLAPLFSSLLNGDFEVRTSGMTLRSSSDNFEADVRVTVVYSAFER